MAGAGRARCRVSSSPTLLAAPPAPTYDTTFLFNNFYTMKTLQRRRAKTMRPEPRGRGRRGSATPISRIKRLRIARSSIRRLARRRPLFPEALYEKRNGPQNTHKRATPPATAE
ncbi:hypothetical protein ACJJTC_007985 [Scirpophaga incertulas]